MAFSRLGSALGRAAIYSDQMSDAIVTVRGEAAIETAPDLATLSCTVHATGSTSEGVRNELAQAAQRVADLIAEFAAAVDSSHTRALHVAPVFNPRTPTKITGYAGQFTTQLVVADFAALSPLVRGLSALPQSQLDGPWWSLRRDHPSRREARLAAIAEAVRRADDYAGAFGRTVGDLLEVSDLDGGFGGGSPMRAFARGKSAEPVEISFEPEPQTVSASVTVRFALAD